MADDVQLTDLEVIQRYSLAVRGATAGRDELIAALQSDLAWLQGTAQEQPPAPAPPPKAKRVAKKSATTRAPRA